MPSRNLLKSKYIKKYGRLIIVVLIVMVGGVCSLVYHNHQIHVKASEMAAANAEKQQLAANQAYDQQQESKNTSQVDCSNYHDPSNPSNLPPLGSFNSTNAACALQCDLSGLVPLLSTGKGLSLQQYQSYVQQMKDNHCGQPQPYCAFTPETPCTSSSSPSDGYNAGYNYAEQYQICDPSYSNGRSQDFNDGVNAWTDANCTDGQPNGN